MSSATTISGGSAGAKTIYDFTVLDGKSQPYPLSQHRGQILLIVNVASKCGFTPQYSGLEKLHQTITSKYPAGSFTILGFPCNQFGGQEPGSNEEIQTFCTTNYGVTFPVLGKVDVNGDDKEDPLWAWLKKEKSGIMGLKRVKWNFEKFLVGKDGRVVERWASTTTPAAVGSRVEEELTKAGVRPVAEEVK
ncbi:MAG: hypothetical protein M1816_001772 [Peltula sp. TS41687]|nr:MAG: hypothetical protein M1816_001772 [Peltula sp. TS41687]